MFFDFLKKVIYAADPFACGSGQRHTDKKCNIPPILSTPLTTPPKTTIQKQELTPYQLSYCKEIVLYYIVR